MMKQNAKLRSLLHILLVIALLWSGYGAATPITLQARATLDQSLYAESLAAGWQDWSWGTTSNADDCSACVALAKTIQSTPKRSRQCDARGSTLC